MHRDCTSVADGRRSPFPGWTDPEQDEEIMAFAAQDTYVHTALEMQAYAENAGTMHWPTLMLAAASLALTFNALAGVRYRLWLRIMAAAYRKWNDSVYVQFSGTVDAGAGATLIAAAKIARTAMSTGRRLSIVVSCGMGDCAGILTRRRSLQRVQKG